MKQLKYFEKLSLFSHVPFFTAEDASYQNVPRHALSYLVKKGDLIRVYPGAYRFSEYELKVEFQWENLALVAASIPKGIICLVSALYYYDLTDQKMKEIWIAVPHESHAPKRPHARIVRMRNMTLGKTSLILGEYKVQIFDRERCIIDAFRYLSIEIALKALQRYLKSEDQKPDFKKLGDYAKMLRVDITPYVLSYTT
ncbi:type IV toxin-antitoxin system AbiEi family antitoxin domain-containing protein [Rhabdochlamydiaceae symbiont of Dictyostelium giganteum]|uniref:type IV toxin-antitoxin system AbiEi family antitoxin domain-containing protein n=1 Tax=Rhabdochlamydiaceae symbiont of Dictyostelium giganteum TaxID=3342349 RepID=UPI0038510FFA